MIDYLSVSEAARQLSEEHGIEVRPQDLSNLLYHRAIPDGLCPMVGGRRLVPRDCLPVIVAALLDRGLIDPGAGGQKK
jgi:hypothetical protein